MLTSVTEPDFIPNARFKASQLAHNMIPVRAEPAILISIKLPGF